MTCLSLLVRSRKWKILLKKVIGSGNSQIVVPVEKQLRLLRAYHDEVGYREAFATGKLVL